MTAMLYTQDVDGTPWTEAKASHWVAVVARRRQLVADLRAQGVPMPWDAALMVAEADRQQQAADLLAHRERMDRRGASR